MGLDTVNWKRWNDNGTLSQVGKTHYLGDDGNTLCGRSFQAPNIETDHSENGWADCKRCQKIQSNLPPEEKWRE